MLQFPCISFCRGIYKKKRTSEALGRFEREFADTRALQPKDGLEDVMLAPTVQGHELHFLTNTRGWKDEDDGHRTGVKTFHNQEGQADLTVCETHLNTSPASSSGPSLVAEQPAQNEGAAVRLQDVTHEPSMQMPADTVDSESAASDHERLPSDGAAEDIVAQQHDHTSTEPFVQPSLAAAGSVAPDIANRDATASCSAAAIPFVDHSEMASSAAAASAASSVASAAAEMFRGQLAAITSSAF
jgi:hypothetical protein